MSRLNRALTIIYDTFSFEIEEQERLLYKERMRLAGTPLAYTEKECQTYSHERQPTYLYTREFKASIKNKYVELLKDQVIDDKKEGDYYKVKFNDGSISKIFKATDNCHSVIKKPDFYIFEITKEKFGESLDLVRYITVTEADFGLKDDRKF